MEYRRALPEDLPGILDLQDKNLFWNLSEQERSNGFLSTAFTREQFEEMNSTVGIVVCLDAGKVLGYCCGSVPEFNRLIPFPGALVQHCSSLVHKNRPVSSYNYCLVNPICIDRNYHGAGMYGPLLLKVVELASTRFELAVGFISSQNLRHLNAIKKLNIDFVSEFTKDCHTFHVLLKSLV